MRLFIAYEISSDAKKHLREIQRSALSGTWLSARMIQPEQMHVTLAFLGEKSASQAKSIIGSLKKVDFHEFSVSLSNLGYFPGLKFPRVIWAGLKPEKESIELHKRIIKSLGVRPKAHLGFKPHVTLARVKHIYDTNKLSELLTPLKKLEFIVTAFWLYQSVLTPQGPKYYPLKEFKAQGI